MSENQTAVPVWRPAPEFIRASLLYLGLGIAVIGAAALALSFASVAAAAHPYFGDASWVIPVIADVTIAILFFLSISMEMNGLRSPLASYGAKALVGFTVYANVAPQHGVYGKILHGAPPIVWTLTVVIAEGAIRKLVGLTDTHRIEPLRKSLWLLRPFATWRIWRQMRVHQITTYAEALDRDAARAAVVGRLRLHHGRMWRSKAPLAERIALRLQGRDPDGVAEVLTAHQATTALLSDTGTDPVPEPFQAAPEPPAEDTSQEQPKTVRRRTPGRTRKSAKTAAPRRSEAELIQAASALNAEALAQTGTPVSLRRLKTELRVGQPTAERLRHALAATPVTDPFATQHTAPQPVPDAAKDGAVQPIEYANGTPV